MLSYSFKNLLASLPTKKSFDKIEAIKYIIKQTNKKDLSIRNESGMWLVVKKIIKMRRDYITIKELDKLIEDAYFN